MVMTGVSGCCSAISAVAPSNSRTSDGEFGITASLGRSAPACCMAVRRATISVRDGVLWKSWLEQTTATPALCACPMRAGSSSRFGKNSMSSRSAQPLTQTVPQKSAYCCGVREVSPPSALVRKVTSRSFSPSAARRPDSTRFSAAASRASENQSARHSMQSAFSADSHLASRRISSSVRATMGRMTFGRPAPMQQPRMVMLDMITTSLQKRYFHHTACPAACQACRSKNRKQVVFCGNLHLRDGRKSFTISAAKAVWPAWGCAAFFVLGGKENEGNENDCAGAGGLSGS